MRLTWLVSPILAALSASGCVRTNIEMLAPVAYAPVDPDSVQVFVTAEEAPSRRVQLAVVTSVQQGGTPGDREESRERVTRGLREKASEVGANAIIIKDISPRPDARDFLRGWAVAIRTGVAAGEATQDSTAHEPAAVTPPWAPPPASVAVREPSPVIYVLGGMGIGAFTGFLAGGLGDLVAEHGPDPSAYCYDHDCWLEGAVIVGAAGAVIGLVVWAVKKGSSADQSQTLAALDRLRLLQVAPQHDGRLGLGLSVRF
jgi:hypothetical protein